MREQLIKIVLLWATQVFIVILLLGLLVNDGFPLLIRAILFCGLLAVLEAVVAKKTIMGMDKNNYNEKCHTDISLSAGRDNIIAIIPDKKKGATI